MHKMRKAAGLGGRWLREAEVRRMVGLDHSGGHPHDGQRAGRSVSGVPRIHLRAAVGRGALVHEGSPVNRIDPSSRDVTVVTPHGQITADRVVIATGYSTPFCETLAARFRLLDTYVLGTRPIAAGRRALGLADVMLWDTGRPYHHARWTSDHRLLLGGGDRPHRSGKARERGMAAGVRDVRDYFAALYPALETIAFGTSGRACSRRRPMVCLHRSAPALPAPLVRVGIRRERDDAGDFSRPGCW